MTRIPARVESRAEALTGAGFTILPGPFPAAGEAFEAAAALLDAVPPDLDRSALEVLGDFVIPPADGPPSRDFQTLHFDFGLPVDPVVPADVARYTALHAPIDHVPSTAQTRLVALDALLSQAEWPESGDLVSRLTAYGETHGNRADAQGYVEGSLARIVEAAAGGEPQLPSVRADPDFLCGNEFGSLTAELDFFAGHGLAVLDAQRQVTIDPGAVLVFDNLALAHGRRGARQPGGLLQRVFGHRGLDVDGQRQLRDRVLASFSADPACRAGS